MFDYSPLWETMRRKHVTTYNLIQKHSFSKGTLDSLKHNRNVTLNTIDDLCNILHVPIEEVVKISFSDENSAENR